jgi:hypothetical protein
MTETSLFSEPVINVIEQDIRGLRGAAEQSGSAGPTQQLDAAAIDAVSVRRRREFDAARSRLREQTVRGDADVVRQPDASPGTDAQSKGKTTARAPLDQPPERVRKRYLRAGNQYFLKDAPYQLAFEDLGPYLVTEHNRPDVVESMVDIASAKSWTRIRVSGHEAFRAEVWLQGTLLGIEVRGYEPNAADLARLADARQARPKNRMEADTSMPPAGTQSPPDDNSTLAQASTSRAETPDDKSGTARPVSARSGQQPRPHRAESQMVSDEPETPRQYAGELREHGRAPYLHNPARSDSYYVAFRDARGTERVVWGVDLERAVLASRAQPGQHVTLENLGRRLVTVKVPILDDQGAVVGEQEKDVYRNTWQVDVAQRERSTAESGGRPDHSSGTAASGNAPAREERQAHRRSTVSDEDKVLHLAVLVGAMREQGFTARSIARVQQRAEEMLDAFGREGITVPRPRVFDPKAPSERDRRGRQAAGRASVREVEREIGRTPVEPSPAR